MIRCPKCQRELPEDSKFCNYCGKRFLTSSEKSTKKKVIAVVAVALAVIIALSGFLVFDKINNKPENDTGKKSDKMNKDDEDNNSVINTGDKDIYQAPNGKYYRLASIKLSYQSDDTDGIEQTMNLTWSKNSVTTDESGSITYKFNTDGMPYECSNSDDSFNYNWTYKDGLLKELTGEYFTYQFEHNKNGNVIKKIQLTENTVAETVNYEYDSQNRLTGFTTDSPSAFEQVEIRYLDKNTIALDCSYGNETIKDFLTFYYNDYGKITDFSAEIEDQQNNFYFTYDKNQNLTEVSVESYDPALGTTIINYELVWEESSREQAVFSDNMASGILFSSGLFGEFENISFYRNPLTFTYFV